MEEDLSITLEPTNKLWHMRGHFGVVFHAQSNVEVTVQMQEDLLDPMDTLWRMKGPFLVFMSNPMLRSLNKSADMEDDISDLA